MLHLYFRVPCPHVFPTFITPTSLKIRYAVLLKCYAYSLSLQMHKLDKDEERLWESLDDIDVFGVIDCVPCTPIFYPDAGDENLINTGGKRLYVVRKGLVPRVYSNWYVGLHVSSAID